MGSQSPSKRPSASGGKRAALTGETPTCPVVYSRRWLVERARHRRELASSSPATVAVATCVSVVTLGVLKAPTGLRLLRVPSGTQCVSPILRRSPRNWLTCRTACQCAVSRISPPVGDVTDLLDGDIADEQHFAHVAALRSSQGQHPPGSKQSGLGRYHTNTYVYRMLVIR
jgi:hypothetical protein